MLGIVIQSSCCYRRIIIITPAISLALEATNPLQSHQRNHQMKRHFTVLSVLNFECTVRKDILEFS